MRQSAIEICLIIAGSSQNIAHCHCMNIVIQSYNKAFKSRIARSDTRPAKRGDQRSGSPATKVEIRR
jgi:hypothetical protein